MAAKSSRSTRKARRKPAKRFTIAPGFYVGVVVVFGLALLWVIANVPALQEFRSAQETRDAEHAKTAELQTEIADLTKRKSRFDKGPDEMEREIRERYKMVKEGERLIEVEVNKKWYQQEATP